jgi:hypothetical protein
MTPPEPCPERSNSRLQPQQLTHKIQVCISLIFPKAKVHFAIKLTKSNSFLMRYEKFFLTISKLIMLS